MYANIEPIVTFGQELIVTRRSVTIEPMVTEDERVQFSQRLNLALDRKDVPAKGHGRQGAVGRMFKVTQKGARKWLEGEAIPATWRIAKMAERLGVNGEWLLTGQGPMHREAQQAPPLDRKLLVEATEAAVRIAGNLGMHLTPDEMGEFAALIYEFWSDAPDEASRVNPERILKLVRSR